jgi:hypothetical protein
MAREILKSRWYGSSNLKAYYRMERYAITTDASGNSKTLTNNNSVGDGEGIGVFGDCADFGTTNTNKTLSIADNLGIAGSGDRTFAFWIKLRTEISSGYDTFFEFNSTLTATRYTKIYYDYYAGTRRLMFDGAGGAVGYTITMGTSNWYHLGITVSSGGTVKAYINGAFVGTFAVSTGALTGNYLKIGGDATYFAKAYIDDFIALNTVLTADDFKEIYEGRMIGELRAEGTSIIEYPKELNSSPLLAALSANLKGYWRLENNLDDSSGSGYNLTNSGSVNNASGKFGQCREFTSASSHYATITDCPNLRVNGDHSFCGWIYPHEVTTIGRFWGLTDSATTNYSIFYVQNGKIGFQLSNSDTTSDESIITITANQWYFIAGIFNVTAGYKDIYVNDHCTRLPIVTQTHNGGSGAFSIGRAGAYTSQYYDGLVDDVMFFNTALSPSQIHEIYTQRGGMVGLWHLNNNISDYSGTDNNITIGGSAAYADGKFGKGISLVRSSNQYLTIPYKSAYDFGTDNFSAALWYKRISSGTGNFSGLMTSRIGDTNGWHFPRGASENFSFACGASNSFDATGNYTISDSNWHYIVGVRGARLELYVDGVLVASGLNNRKNVSTGQEIRVGQYRYNETTNGLDGTVDDIALYNRALTEKEIRQWYSWAKGKYK